MVRSVTRIKAHPSRTPKQASATFRENVLGQLRSRHLIRAKPTLYEVQRVLRHPQLRLFSHSPDEVRTQLMAFHSKLMEGNVQIPLIVAESFSHILVTAQQPNDAHLSRYIGSIADALVKQGVDTYREETDTFDHIPGAPEPMTQAPIIADRRALSQGRFHEDHLTSDPEIAVALHALAPEFELGVAVQNVNEEGGVGISNVYRQAPYAIRRRLFGTDRSDWMPSSATAYRAYQIWMDEHGFAPSKSVTEHSFVFIALKAFGIDVDISMNLGNSDTEVSLLQIHYLHCALAWLPKKFLLSPYIKKLTICTHQRGQAAMGAYQDGEISLYSGLFAGPRKNLLGMLYHELGHSSAQRYARHRLPGNTRGPDRSISRRRRHALWKAIDTIRHGGFTYALDWLDGRDARRKYMEDDAAEFLAEHHLIYIADGPGLRVHIHSLDEGPIKKAYQLIYNELRDGIFAGEEF